MWINNNISKPLRKGVYKTLVDSDGLGNLEEVNNELFNGVDWDVYNSHSQIIPFWWAEKEDYEIISDRIEAEIIRTDVGCYQLDKIKANTTYVMTHLEGEEPKIEKKDGK